MQPYSLSEHYEFITPSTLRLLKEKIVGGRKEPYYRDIIHAITREDRDYHWSIAYKWYFYLLEDKQGTNQAWVTRIVKAGCIPKVTNFMVIVLWCAMKFDHCKRIIHLKESDKNHVCLTPTL